MRDDNEIFRKILAGFIHNEDPLLGMMEWMMKQLMEIEVENQIGAKKNEHSNKRTGYFSGYRPRRFVLSCRLRDSALLHDTRLGTAYLMIPKVRKGGYIPFFITEKKRSEQALLAMVQEAYVNGISTRKIERLAKELGIENISASQVSQINRGLDAQVAEFRDRELHGHYPFVWVDALYEKVRNHEGRVVSMAIMVAYGVNEQGKREVLAVEPFVNESKETWKAFFQKLKARGLQQIALLISDAHYGIHSALKTVYTGASWQRCKVHFMRNILAHVPAKAKEGFASKLKQLWLQESKEEALKITKEITAAYKNSFPQAVEILQEGLEDSLQFYYFPQIDKRRISSTNVLERLNKEIRRRSRVVSIFPSQASYLRLITTNLMEYTEDWEIERSYINPKKLQEVRELYNHELQEVA